jgi:hypothetical protein
MTPLDAYKAKKTIVELLKSPEIAEEAKPALRRLLAILDEAVYAAVPKTKHYEARLENLFRIKTGLKSATA